MKKLLSVLVLFNLAPVYAAESWLLVPEEYSDISEAVTAIREDSTLPKTVRLSAGSYSLTEAVSIPDGVTIEGEDTSSTVISADSGSSVSSLFVVDGVANVTIRNLTFQSADRAISFENSLNSLSSSIKNNVFYMGTDKTAIQIYDQSLPVIWNNTFYGNGVAIKGNATHNLAIDAKYNIFSNNSEVVDAETNSILTTNFAANCHFENTTDITPLDELSQSDDPLFVSISSKDFHLQTGSPCIDGGAIDVATNKDALDDSLTDYGAYGGTNASKAPARVKGVTFTDVSGTDSVYTMNVNWLIDDSYAVKDIGGYRLYFDNESDGEFTFSVSDQLTSPYDLIDYVETDGEATQTIQGITIGAIAPGVPAISSIEPANERIILSWQAVENASAYVVEYQPAGGDTKTLDVGDDTSTILSGLTNGVEYSVSVRATYQPRLYFYLTAYEGLSGDKNESVRYGSAYSVNFGSEIEGASSTPTTAIPDKVIPYPQLPNEGCFIATATYGSYDAAQVQVFRNFRDKILKEHAAGRWFIDRYYQYGPFAAEWLNNNAAFKPVFQALLYPYLLFAGISLQFGLSMALLLLLSGLTVAILFLAVFVSIRKRRYA